MKELRSLFRLLALRRTVGCDYAGGVVETSVSHQLMKVLEAWCRWTEFGKDKQKGKSTQPHCQACSHPQTFSVVCQITFAPMTWL